MPYRPQLVKRPDLAFKHDYRLLNHGAVFSVPPSERIRILHGLLGRKLKATGRDLDFLPELRDSRPTFGSQDIHLRAPQYALHLEGTFVDACLGSLCNLPFCIASSTGHRACCVGDMITRVHLSTRHGGGITRVQFSTSAQQVWRRRRVHDGTSYEARRERKGWTATWFERGRSVHGEMVVPESRNVVVSFGRSLYARVAADTLHTLQAYSYIPAGTKRSEPLAGVCAVCALGGFRTRELIQNRTEHARDATRTRARAPSTYARACHRSISFRIGPMKATHRIERSMSSAALVCRSVSGQIHHQSHPSPSHHPDRRPLVNRCDPHTLIHRGQPRPTFRPPARRREHSRRGQ